MDSNSHKNNTKGTATTKFSKYLVMKPVQEGLKLTKVNTFKVEKGFKDILGNHSCKIKQLRSGLLLIEVDQKKNCNKLLQTTKLADIPVTVEEHSSLNICKGTIYCECLEGVSDAQIAEKLKDQDVKEVYRQQRREGEDLVPTNRFVITFDKTTLPKEVKVGYLICKVRLYIPNPRRCFKCQGYGHGKSTCKHEPVCARCGETGHDFKDCQQDPWCIHCHGEHPASDKKCPMYLF